MIEVWFGSLKVSVSKSFAKEHGLSEGKEMSQDQYNAALEDSDTYVHGAGI